MSDEIEVPVGGGAMLVVRESGDAGVLIEARLAGADAGTDMDTDAGTSASRRAVRLAQAAVEQRTTSGTLRGVVNTLATYDHVFVTLDAAVTDPETAASAIADAVRELAASPDATPEPHDRRVLDLPVVFGGAHGPDLDEVAAHLRLAPEQLIDRLTATAFEIDFLGTAMQPMCTGAVGDTPIPRRTSPRTSLPAGSVGLAAHNLTVYPFDSPGGWQLVGRTPVTLVDIDRDPVVAYRPGDVIRLRAIAADNWDAWTSRSLNPPPDPGHPPLSHPPSAPGPRPASGGNDSARHETAAHGALRVLHAGNAHLQDLGRIDTERAGIGPGGALDQIAAMRANILVGNPRSAPLLEITALDAEFLFEDAALIAVCGASASIAVDDVPQPADTPIVVRDGQRLAIGGIHNGARVAVAVAGGFEGHAFLGSVAPDPIVGFGTRLTAGERLRFSRPLRDYRHPVFELPLFRFDVPHERRGETWRIPVTVGTELDWLADGIDALTDAEFEVTQQSDTVGQRLSGPPLEVVSRGELVSRGVPVGGVELLQNGELIVLQRSRYITAGYPIVAVVTRFGLSTLGQATPGRRIRFVQQTRADAIEAWRRAVAQLDDLERRVGTAYAAAGMARDR